MRVTRRVRNYLKKKENFLPSYYRARSGLQITRTSNVTLLTDPAPRHGAIGPHLRIFEFPAGAFRHRRCHKRSIRGSNGPVLKKNCA